MTAAVAGAVIVHESCHALAIWLFGGRVIRVTLSFCGAEMRCTGLKTGAELVSAAAGPIGSFALALILSRAGLYVASGVSLVLGSFNLLPVYPLDGGRVLFASLRLFLRYETALRVRDIVSLVTLAAFTLAAVYAAIVYRSYIFLPAGIGVWRMRNLH